MHFVSNIHIRGLRGDDPYIRDDVCGLPYQISLWSAEVRTWYCTETWFGRPCSVQEVATQIMVAGREKLQGFFSLGQSFDLPTLLLLLGSKQMAFGKLN